MKYGRLVVFIRNDSGEIWGFRYGLTLIIGTQKNIASTGVFVRVVFALRHSNKNFLSTPSMILQRINKATAIKKWARAYSLCSFKTFLTSNKKPSCVNIDSNWYVPVLKQSLNFNYNWMF
jgi:hypothetical protein